MSKKYVIKNEYNEYYQKEIFENGEYIPKFTKHMSRSKIYTSLKAIQSALKRIERKNVFKQYRSIVIAEIDERMIAREPLNVKDENLKEVGGNPTRNELLFDLWSKNFLEEISRSRKLNSMNKVDKMFKIVDQISFLEASLDTLKKT